MGLGATKPVSWVSDKVRFNVACSATKTSLTIETVLLTSLDMILSNKQITKAQIRLRGCAGWSAALLFANPKDRFSHVKAHILSGRPPLGQGLEVLI